MNLEQVKLRYGKKFLRNDLLVVTAMTLVFIGLTIIWPTLLDSVSHAARSQLYATVAAIAAALTGFALVSITLLLDVTTLPPMKILRESPYFPDLFETFLSATRHLGLATLVFLGVLLLDTGEHVSVWLFALVAWTGLMSIARLLRCLWILSAVIRIMAKSGN